MWCVYVCVGRGYLIPIEEEEVASPESMGYNCPRMRSPILDGRQLFPQ